MIDVRQGGDMAAFMMFGRYSSEALKGISPDRTSMAGDLLKKFGGEVNAIYALLGTSDLVLIVDLPGVEQAMQASIALGKATGISFSTSPALKVESFDNLMSGV